MAWSIAGTLTVAVLAGAAGLGQQRSGDLKIVVIKGEDAVNIVQQKTAVAPVVEIRDRNDLPVPGALVTFSIQGGKTASFAGGAQAITVTTNAAGQAVASGLNPIVSGAVQINVQAAFQGQITAATIAQTNVMTAAQATAVGSGTGSGAGSGTGAAGSGGGGVSGTTLTVLGGAVGAGAAAAVLTRSETAPSSIRVSPMGNGIRDVTEFSFTAVGEGQRFEWDFGDGATESGASVTHTYTREGTFQVSFRNDGAPGPSASVPVTVGTLTGNWIRDTVSGVTNRLVVVQQGNRLTGQWWIEFDVGSPFGGPQNNGFVPLIGTITSPRTVSLQQDGECGRTIPSGNVSSDLSSMGGNGSYGNSACTGMGGDFTFRRR
jgi:hypothetical protein